jgi:alanine dehydrogenase
VLIINEREARSLVSMADAIEVMQAAFAADAEGDVATFPVVRETLTEVDGVFGVKSAAHRTKDLLGLKAGGYWRRNAGAGLTNHQSSTVLFNKAHGTPAAFVSSNYLTGLRTAAVAGLATRYLARQDAAVLGVIGAGGQALFQIEAIRAVRPISRVLVASRGRENAEAVVAEVQRSGEVEAAVVDIAFACRHADIITTITPSTEAVVLADWVRPGTHINAMGADTRGKREIDPALIQRATTFVDDWTQAKSLGECQHLASVEKLDETSIAGTIGKLAAGLHPGRREAAEITLFDSTGVAIQDLAIAHYVVEQGRLTGAGLEVSLTEAN